MTRVAEDRGTHGKAGYPTEAAQGFTIDVSCAGIPARLDFRLPGRG